MKLSLLLLSAWLLLFPVHVFAAGVKPLVTISHLPEDLLIKVVDELSESQEDIKSVFQVSRKWKRCAQCVVDKNPYLSMVLNKFSDKWIQKADVAAVNDMTPEYLLSILKMEKLLFYEMVTLREKSLVGPEDWKRHVIACMLSFTSVRSLVWRGMRQAAVEGAWRLSKIEIDQKTRYVERDMAWGAVRRAVENGGAYWLNVLGEAERALQEKATPSDLVWKAKKSVGSAVSEHATRRLLAQKKVPSRINRVASIFDTYVPGLDVLGYVASQAIYTETVAKQLAHIAYRVAEMEVWSMVLDPRFALFDRAYQASFAKLQKAVIDQGAFDDWFSSKEHFIFKMNEYFGLSDQDGGLGVREEYNLRIQFVQHLVDVLMLSCDKVFDESLTS